MLAPYCELDVSEKEIAELGADSPELWRKIIAQFDLDVFFQHNGSLVVAHPQDHDELMRFKRSVTTKASADVFKTVSGDDLLALEPELDRRYASGLYFPHEGQIDSRGALKAMGDALQRLNILRRFNQHADYVGSHEIRIGVECLRFDIVLDCRGYGATQDIPDLRAVRGELIRVDAPDVHFNRPVRLMHPRYPLYVVPRPNGHYVIGATQIESEDASPISVRSTLELLSAAYALHAGFSEARVVETVVGLRPAFPDNHPRILHEQGLIRVNGMFRHGYLLTPKVTDAVCALVEQGKQAPEHNRLFRKAA